MNQLLRIRRLSTNICVCSKEFSDLDLHRSESLSARGSDSFAFGWSGLIGTSGSWKIGRDGPRAGTPDWKTTGLTRGPDGFRAGWSDRRALWLDDLGGVRALRSDAKTPRLRTWRLHFFAQARKFRQSKRICAPVRKRTRRHPKMRRAP